MDRNDLAIVEAAAAQDVSVHKADGVWKVGLSPATIGLSAAKPAQVDTFIGGGMIRLGTGRILKMEMTDQEARAEFGLPEPDPET